MFISCLGYGTRTDGQNTLCRGESVSYSLPDTHTHTHTYTYTRTHAILLAGQWGVDAYVCACVYVLVCVTSLSCCLSLCNRPSRLYWVFLSPPTFLFLSPLHFIPYLSPFFLLLSTYALLSTQLLLTLLTSSSTSQARQSRALSVPDLWNILEELSSSRIDTAEYRKTLYLTGNSGMVRYSQQGESSSTVSQSLRCAMQAAALEHHQTSSSPSSSVSAAAAQPPVVIVCGTAFIMAAARVELGINEPRDSESLSDPLSGEDKDVDSQVLHTTLSRIGYYLLSTHSIYYEFSPFSSNRYSICYLCAFSILSF